MSTSAYSFAGLNGVNGFQAWGISSDAMTGLSVAVVGDVNGDGLTDWLYGSPYEGPTDQGRFYLVTGTAGAWPMTVWTGQNGTYQGMYTLLGGAANDRMGWSAAAAGDMNGDGFGDVVVSAPNFDGNGSDSGASYVIFGRATLLSDVGAFNGTQGFRIDGAAGVRSGYSVASAGDVNGDGFADLIIGTDPAVGSGLSYVVFGKGSGWTPTLNVASLNGTNGFVIDLLANIDSVTDAVASAGDLNGDGFADILVGVPGADFSGTNTGSVYVVFGRASGWTSSISLAALNGTNGFRIDGVTNLDSIGSAIAAAGDVNGDGFGDVIIGSYGADPNGNNSGAAYVLFGRAGTWAPSLNLSTLNGTNGVRIDGPRAAEFAGSSVAGAGDVNGDGFADVIVGASRAHYSSVVQDEFGNRAAYGAVYVVYGKGGSWEPTLNLGDLQDQGYRIDGVSGSFGTGGVGVSVAGGDIDNDGFSDILTGAPYAATVYAHFSLAGGGATYRGTTLADTLRGTDAGDRMDGGGQNDRLFGKNGNDTIDGGAGNDQMDGGAGFDTGSYGSAAAGVTVSLALATAQNTGGAGTDTLLNFENLLGSAFNDVLAGNAGSNTLTGGLGNDLLNGGAGNDVLAGGAGPDTAVFSGNRASYTLTKNTGTTWTVTGPDGTDRTTGVERLQFADQTVTIGFARTEDMAGRGFGDVLFQSTAGGWLYRWQMEGTRRTAEAALSGPGTGWVMAGKGDLNGDLNADILWRNTGNGDLYGWLMNGTSRIGEGGVGTLAAGHSVAGIGDMDGDGRADILLRGSDGMWAVQRMNGTSILGIAGGTLDTAWSVAAVADFNDDLRADVLWRNGTTGQLYLWQMNGAAVSAQNSYATPGAGWQVIGAGDLNGDGRADVVVRNGSGWLWGYLTDATNASAGTNQWLGFEGGGFTLRKVADYTGDDRADLLYFDAAGGNVLLQGMNGLSMIDQQIVGAAGAGFGIL